MTASFHLLQPTYGDRDDRPLARRISRQGWSAAGEGLIFLRRELELTPGCGCGPIIDSRTKLNLTVHNAIINDVDKPTSTTLLFEALAHGCHPLPVGELVILEALGHTLIISPRNSTWLASNTCTSSGHKSSPLRNVSTAKPLRWSFGLSSE